MESREMLKHTKLILENVSFDAELFVKEFQKAFVQLLPYDSDCLIEWVDDFIADKPFLQEKLVSKEAGFNYS